MSTDKSKKHNSFLGDDELETLEDAQLGPDKPKKFWVTEGKTDRLGFPLVTEDGKLVIKTFKYLKIKGEDGKWLKLIEPKDPELLKQCLRKGAQQETRAATVVLVYNTNEEGKIVKPASGKLMILSHGTSKFKKLKALHGEHDLTITDVLVTTDNPDYNNMDFSVGKSGEARWRKDNLS